MIVHYIDPNRVIYGIQEKGKERGNCSLIECMRPLSHYHAESNGKSHGALPTCDGIFILGIRFFSKRGGVGGGG